MSKIRVALYPRVSTQEQANEGYSIGEQIEKLTKYCEAMDWEIYKIYTDPGYSGGNTDRPGLQAMLSDVRDGKVHKVVVYKLDRLSRSQKDTMLLIEDEFLAHGVDFVSMSENFDTSTPFGRAMIGILAVFAQLERENIKERTMIGKEARAKAGLWGGGNCLPFGYDYIVADDKLVPNAYERVIVKEMYDLYLKGTPLKRIEKILEDKGYRGKKGGVIDTKSIRTTLSSKNNIGYVRHKDDWYKGDHEPIIDEDTFNKTQKLLQERREQAEAYNVRWGHITTYLGGLIYCSHCTAKYTKQKGGSKKYGILYYYVCYSRNKKTKKMIKDPNCMNKSWRVEALDNLIFDEIRKLATDPNYIHDIRNAKHKDDDKVEKIDVLNKEIAKLDNQISRFMDLYSLGNLSLDAIKDKIDPIANQKSALEKEVQALTRSGSELSEEETIEIVSSFEDVLERGDFDEIRLLIESLIEKIEIDNDDVTIYWKFA